MKRLKLNKIRNSLEISFELLEQLGFEKVNIDEDELIWYKYTAYEDNDTIIDILVENDGYFTISTDITNNRSNYDNISNTTTILLDIPEIFDVLFKLNLVKFVEED